MKKLSDKIKNCILKWLTQPDTNQKEVEQNFNDAGLNQDSIPNQYINNNIMDLDIVIFNMGFTDETKVSYKFHARYMTAKEKRTN